MMSDNTRTLVAMFAGGGLGLLINDVYGWVRKRQVKR